MSKKLFAIPEDWSWTTMGEIADVIGGGTPKTKIPANYQGGTIPWLTPADLSGYTEKFVGRGSRFITEVGLSSSSARMMPAGTVLFTSRAPIGYVAIASNDISTNQGFKSFVLKGKNILPEYVYWWLKGNKELAESYASGTTFLELSGAKAKQLPIPIAPLEQQKRIVAEIEKQFSRLDEAVANLKRVKANLKRYKAAVLKAAVEGKLTEEWRRGEIHRAHSPAERDNQGVVNQGAMNCAPTQPVETGAELLQRILAERRANWQGKGKYKEPVAPDTSGLPELPAGWVWAKLGSLPVDVFDGPFGSNLKSSDYVSSGIRVIRLENIGSREFVDEKESFVTEQKYEQLKKHTVRHGDIIFSSFVANETRVVMLPEHIGMAINKADCFCVRVNNEDFNKRFLETFLATRTAYEQLVGEVHGATRPRINTTQLKECLIPIPPVDEQAEIVSRMSSILSVVEVFEAQVDANLRRADRLRQSILKQAFSGQLVPQNPNDEPASVLLERIKNDVGARFIAPKSTPRQSRKAKPEQSEKRAQSIAPLQETITAILAAMQPGREYARADLADPLGLTAGKWNAAIQELKRLGKVRQAGERRGASTAVS